MTDTCGRGCGAELSGPPTKVYRRVLSVVVGLNATMFAIESAAGYFAASSALQADALDFLGDTITYSLTLWVLEKSLHWRTSIALVKGLSLFGLGLIVLTTAGIRWVGHTQPEVATMGAVGVLALLVNIGSALLLYRHREGDCNVRSVWLCSRNDAIGNLAVLSAAGLISWTGSRWPDLLVAGGIASLFVHSSLQIVRAALAERQARAAHA